MPDFLLQDKESGQNPIFNRSYHLGILAGDILAFVPARLGFKMRINLHCRSWSTSPRACPLSILVHTNSPGLWYYSYRNLHVIL